MPRATRRKVLAPVDENVVGKDTSTADVVKLIESIETQGKNYFYIISWVYVVVVEISLGLGLFNDILGWSTFSQATTLYSCNDG